MTDDESEVGETVMLTRRDRRRGGVVVGSPAAPSESEAAVADGAAETHDSTAADDSEAPGDVDEATVVVDRHPIAVDEPADALGEPADALGEPVDPLEEATVVVDRSPSRSDSRSDVPDGARDGEREQELPDEPTVLVSRTPRRVRRKRSERPEQGDAVVDPAPVTDPVTDPSAAAVSFEAPTDAPEPAIYRPRPAPLGPSAPPVVIGAAAPTRAVDPELPSVTKQGLRWSVTTLLAFAAACVVSAAGLVALGFVVFA
ncbi:hypothetical protein ASF87_08660 [Microbacterium sp. Leaf161]|uniref:hypothetical protein n=1 Tax=Microbacterium sp. Leaf161 TaxID=1736281 RepID=UPI0006F5876A|nr:hypothetical protein [Microbacterium sp. Leaf161]KQR48889.1 hypothetical protein ASF87_08660 [Microbacterium sp. Leaf161]